MEAMRKRLMQAKVSWGAECSTAWIAALESAPQARPESESESERASPFDSSTAVDDAPQETSCEMDSDYTNQDDFAHRKSFITSWEWTVESLVASGPRFLPVPRVSALQSPQELQDAIDKHERTGIPLVIENWHNHAKWPKDIFDVEWFREHANKEANARNVRNWSDRSLPMPELIDILRAATPFSTPEETERWYGKDAECPEAWTEWLEKGGVIPQSLIRYGSNDLLQYLPKTGDGAHAVETLMCYLGVGDTFTPCHKDLCGSSGQNIMCYTENGGSSFWFMTESASAPAAAEYFHRLKEELDLETHAITVDELAKAPFKVYVVEQKLGDMVLVPPRSCHQVVNHGGITIKASWSRMTLKGLTAALYHELPIYRRVCRKETYRVKSNIYSALQHYTSELEGTTINPGEGAPSVRNLARTVLELLRMLDDILVEEWCEGHGAMEGLGISTPTPNSPEDFSEHVECDFCGADIFQSFFECPKCPPPGAISDSREGSPEGGLTLCAACYVEGRSCACEIMEPMQCRPFSNLLRTRNKAMQVLRDSQATEELFTGQIALTELSEDQLFSPPPDGPLKIFEAACILRKTRRAMSLKTPPGTKATRSCTTRVAPSHIVLHASSLLCRKCHSRKCFHHILTDSYVHSAEAILAGTQSADDEFWHVRHQAGRSEFQDAKAGLAQAERDGVRPNPRHKLAETALVYSTCKPIDKQSTCPGWYDRYVQISDIPISTAKQTVEIVLEELPKPSPSSSAGDLSPLEALTPLSSPEQMFSALPEANDQAMGDPVRAPSPLPSPTSSEHSVGPKVLAKLPESSSRKRKRPMEVFDGVVLPPVPSSSLRGFRSEAPSRPPTSQSSSAMEVDAMTSIQSPPRNADALSEPIGPPHNKKAKASPSQPLTRRELRAAKNLNHSTPGHRQISRSNHSVPRSPQTAKRVPSGSVASPTRPVDIAQDKPRGDRPRPQPKKTRPLAKDSGPSSEAGPSHAAALADSISNALRTKPVSRPLASTSGTQSQDHRPIVAIPDITKHTSQPVVAPPPAAPPSASPAVIASPATTSQPAVTRSAPTSQQDSDKIMKLMEDMKSSQDRWRKEVEKQATESRAAAAEAIEKVHMLEKRMSENRELADKDIRRMQEDHSAKVERLEAKITNMENELKVKNSREAQLQKSLTACRNTIDKQEHNFKAHLDSLQKRVKDTLNEQSSKLQTELAKVQSHLDGLQNLMPLQAEVRDTRLDDNQALIREVINAIRSTPAPVRGPIVIEQNALSNAMWEEQMQERMNLSWGRPLPPAGWNTGAWQNTSGPNYQQFSGPTPLAGVGPRFGDFGPRNSNFKMNNRGKPRMKFSGQFHPSNGPGNFQQRAQADMTTSRFEPDSQPRPQSSGRDTQKRDSGHRNTSSAAGGQLSDTNGEPSRSSTGHGAGQNETHSEDRHGTTKGRRKSRFEDRIPTGVGASPATPEPEPSEHASGDGRSPGSPADLAESVQNEARGPPARPNETPRDHRRSLSVDHWEDNYETPGDPPADRERLKTQPSKEKHDARDQLAMKPPPYMPPAENPWANAGP